VGCPSADRLTYPGAVPDWDGMDVYAGAALRPVPGYKQCAAVYQSHPCPAARLSAFSSLRAQGIFRKESEKPVFSWNSIKVTLIL